LVNSGFSTNSFYHFFGIFSICPPRQKRKAEARAENPMNAHVLPDPYERLILDAIRGDQTFFADSAEIEASWKFVDTLIEARNNPLIYEPGSWGPEAADELIKKDGREWLMPSNAFCNISYPVH
jgi:glucose-6-phosphate 1-dehydrogenase